MYEYDSFMREVYKDERPDLFYGDVLYLGMGPLWMARNQSNQVTSTTIIEHDQRIISRFEMYMDPEWKVILADVTTYEPNQKYDIIFADIWENMYNYEELRQIFDRYKNHVKPGGRIECLKRLVRKNTIPDGVELTHKNI